jgi:AcrR family transcriptional regulator
MRASSPDSSRARLLAAGKLLFARLGYENTSTSALAHQAGTSESQLVRYFTGKAGLLDAIFEDAWAPLNARVRDLLADARSSREAVEAVLVSVLQAFDRDDQLATIFLFEGRRIRGEGAVRMSRGFLDFADIVQRLIRRGQKDGSFSDSYDAAALASALMGATEAMVRERMLARRARGKSFPEKQVQKIFSAMLDGFEPAARR